MRLDTIGKNIKKYRLANDFRQEDLALKSGLTANYIGLVERGRKIPSLSAFIAILNALDISADVILADVLSKGYQVKYSVLEEDLSKLSADDRIRVCAIIETFKKIEQSS